MFEQPGACTGCGLGQAVRVGERIDRTTVCVAAGARIETGAEIRIEVIGGDHPNIHAQGLPLRYSPFDPPQRAARVRGLDPAAGIGIAVYAMLINELEDAIRRIAGVTQQAVAALLAEQLAHFAGVPLETRRYEAIVAAGCSPADFCRLEYCNADAFFGQGKRSTDPHDATPDDADIRIDPAAQQRIGFRSRRRCRPERLRHRGNPSFAKRRFHCLQAGRSSVNLSAVPHA